MIAHEIKRDNGGNGKITGITIGADTGSLERDLAKARTESTQFKGQIFKDNPMGMIFGARIPYYFCAMYPQLLTGDVDFLAWFLNKYPQFQATKLLNFGSKKITKS